MKSSGRLLIIFAAAVCLLVIAAFLLVFIGGNKPAEMLPEDSPQGTVQRYLMAIDDGEYLKAYSYLSPPPDDKLTYEIWQQSFYYPSERPAYRVTLGESDISGDNASVEVIVDVFRGGGGPFDNPVNSNHVVFILERAGGAWKITSPTYVWWVY